MHSHRHTAYRRPPQRRRRRGSGIRVWLLLITLILVLSFGIYAIFANDNEGEPIAQNGLGSSERTESGTENGTATGMEDGMGDRTEGQGVASTTPHQIPMRQVSTSDITDTRYLALVNHRHPAPADPAYYLLTAAWPTVAVSRIDNMYLHYSALRAVAEMFATASTANIGAFFVSSGFRDFYLQKYLYGDGTNSAYVMPPGHSEHQTGLAADILSIGIGMHEFAHTPEGRWLADNSYRYGLILRYPQGAEAITGINFEPWHFRYVGRTHAYYMTRLGLVLEQYIQYIRENGQLSFEKDGVIHHVFHMYPQRGMIYVPYGRDFYVSGDNKGGYIVWTTG